jgi:hypothetical protein
MKGKLLLFHRHPDGYQTCGFASRVKCCDKRGNKSFHVFTVAVDQTMVFFWVSAVEWINVPTFRRNIMPPESKTTKLVYVDTEMKSL